jgi:hypothetical protein
MCMTTRGNRKKSLSKYMLALVGKALVPFPFHCTCAAHPCRCPLLSRFSDANGQHMCAHDNPRTIRGGRLATDRFASQTTREHETIPDGRSTDATAHALLRESPSVPQHIHCRCNCRPQTTTADASITIHMRCGAVLQQARGEARAIEAHARQQSQIIAVPLP